MEFKGIFRGFISKHVLQVEPRRGGLYAVSVEPRARLGGVGVYHGNVPMAKLWELAEYLEDVRHTTESVINVMGVNIRLEGDGFHVYVLGSQLRRWLSKGGRA